MTRQPERPEPLFSLSLLGQQNPSASSLLFSSRVSVLPLLPQDLLCLDMTEG